MAPNPSSTTRTPLSGDKTENHLVQAEGLWAPGSSARMTSSTVAAAAQGGIAVRDAVRAAVMLNNDIVNDIAEIATFDEAFDRIAGVTRISL